MLKLSGVIITFNEERNIEQCLHSLVNVVDEIIVVDSFSTDNTKAICKRFDVKFIEQKFLGYIEQKNFALTQASYDHIVSLDGDESLSETLQKSIIDLKSNWKFDGYFANRFNNFCGQWIKHSDWYPNKKLRVFDRRCAEWKGINPHDNVQLHNVKAKSGHLKGDILHKTYQTYSEFNQKTEYFSTIAAKAYYDVGKKAPIWKIIWNPTWAFFKTYFLRLGILDGFNGYVIAVQTANITFLKYSKLRELYKL
ncbi:glycosyltransferase involved in cell wall biosynthesis [Winogradskyella eximia]|jgi:glycosyltransferase involved in cell wall biosynthesis|uniref:Glycosyltransferase involved in cell wall biosynthesis n=1 Tax=Winogradskyella eximia TaxID=262006 RepID=A0A3D9H3D4_9FLAO|nr:glycosyltransferase family 2 protein [Winogradskyella eximia]RED44004.1 glycosyltransferase involved in cell wall biosynthesis [Winogradskyella eximia]